MRWGGGGGCKFLDGSLFAWCAAIQVVRKVEKEDKWYLVRSGDDGFPLVREAERRQRLLGYGVMAAAGCFLGYVLAQLTKGTKKSSG